MTEDCGDADWEAGIGGRKCCCGKFQTKKQYEMHLKRDAAGQCEHELIMRGKRTA